MQGRLLLRTIFFLIYSSQQQAYFAEGGIQATQTTYPAAPQYVAQQPGQYVQQPMACAVLSLRMRNFFPPRRHRGSAQPCHACPGRRPVSNPYPALLQAQYPMVGMQPGMQPGMMVMPQQQMMVTRVPARPIRKGTQA